MADIKYYDVILKPVVTESSMSKMSVTVDTKTKDKNGKFVEGTKEIRKYTFLVHPEANKSQIKDAVEKMFDGVKVEKVNTMNYQGKEKRRGRTFGRTAAKKKAIVTLKADSKDIELFGAN